MNLNAPTKIVFIITLVLALVAVVAKFVAIPFVSAYAFWILLVAFVVLVASTVFKGLYFLF
jgi:heme/copper-type cytochrome/quinol oxidase subunit 1